MIHTVVSQTTYPIAGVVHNINGVLFASYHNLLYFRGAREVVALLLAVLDVHLVLWMCVAIYLLCQLYTHKCNCMLSATHW